MWACADKLGLRKTQAVAAIQHIYVHVSTNYLFLEIYSDLVMCYYYLY